MHKNTREGEELFAFCPFFGRCPAMRAAGRHNPGCPVSGRGGPVNKAQKRLKKTRVFSEQFFRRVSARFRRAFLAAGPRICADWGLWGTSRVARSDKNFGWRGQHPAKYVEEAYL